MEIVVWGLFLVVVVGGLALVKRIEKLEDTVRTLRCEPKFDSNLRYALYRAGIVDVLENGREVYATSFRVGEVHDLRRSLSDLAAALGYERKVTPASPEKAEWMKKACAGSVTFYQPTPSPAFLIHDQPATPKKKRGKK